MSPPCQGMFSFNTLAKRWGQHKQAKSMERELLTKSGLMVGLGERREEVIQVVEDLREVDCDFLTMGQYLRPSINHHEVVRFVPPVDFKSVASAPYVRSSFQADKMFKEISCSQGNVEG